MENQALLLDLLKSGSVDGCSAAPKMVETVISRVFIFDQENLVLKFYKRDNNWWNANMRDLSGGRSRSNFIRQDFAFNQLLNPEIYIDLKKAVVSNGCVTFIDPQESDDELIIVMRKQDLSGVLTDVLFNNLCSLEAYATLGKSYAKVKLAIPRIFLPAIESNWYEQMQSRMKDLVEWVGSEKDFPKNLAKKGLARMSEELEAQKTLFQKIEQKDLFVSIDGNSENLIYAHSKLFFIDAYPPKDEWRIGMFEVDIFRTGADIYAFVGKEAYDSYIRGVQEAAGDYLDMSLSNFYLLYGALIMSPYFFMLSKTNPNYKAKAEKYLSFFEYLMK